MTNTQGGSSAVSKALQVDYGQVEEDHTTEET